MNVESRARKHSAVSADLTLMTRYQGDVTLRGNMTLGFQNRGLSLENNILSDFHATPDSATFLAQRERFAELGSNQQQQHQTTL